MARSEEWEEAVRESQPRLTSEQKWADVHMPFLDTGPQFPKNLRTQGVGERQISHHRMAVSGVGLSATPRLPPVLQGLPRLGPTFF